MKKPSSGLTDNGTVLSTLIIFSYVRKDHRSTNIFNCCSHKILNDCSCQYKRYSRKCFSCLSISQWHWLKLYLWWTRIHGADDSNSSSIIWGKHVIFGCWGSISGRNIVLELGKFRTNYERLLHVGRTTGISSGQPWIWLRPLISLFLLG